MTKKGRYRGVGGRVVGRGCGSAWVRTRLPFKKANPRADGAVDSESGGREVPQYPFSDS